MFRDRGRAKRQAQVHMQDQLCVGSGNDADAKIFLELLKENEGENCVGNQTNPCGDETLQKNVELQYF